MTWTLAGSAPSLMKRSESAALCVPMPTDAAQRRPHQRGARSAGSCSVDASDTRALTITSGTPARAAAAIMLGQISVSTIAPAIGAIGREEATRCPGQVEGRQQDRRCLRGPADPFANSSRARVTPVGDPTVISSGWWGCCCCRTRTSPASAWTSPTDAACNHSGRSCSPRQAESQALTEAVAMRRIAPSAPDHPRHDHRHQQAHQQCVQPVRHSAAITGTRTGGTATAHRRSGAGPRLSSSLSSDRRSRARFASRHRPGLRRLPLSKSIRNTSSSPRSRMLCALRSEWHRP